MKRCVVTAWMVALAASAPAAWPLVIVRYTGAVNGDQPQF